MRVVYLDTAVDDLVWWRQYYGGVFPEGARKAGRQFRKNVALSKTHPRIGHPAGEPDVYGYTIPRTHAVEILRVWDNRRAPGDP